MQLELFRITSKIVHLAKRGRISYARKMFDEMSYRDSVAWNAMLASYSHLGLHQEALTLFRCMRLCSETRPDHFTFTATLSACAGACDLRRGTTVHALILILGYQSYLPIGNALVDMYGKCLSPSSATRVFEEMDIRNEVTWCSLLFAYVKSCQFDIADKVFAIMPTRVEIAWNIRIAGQAWRGEVESCLVLLKEMLKNSCCPDKWTLSSLMNACVESSEVLYGFMLHAFIIKSGWSSAVEAMNSLLSFYAEQGYLGDAIKIFESIGTPSLVSWNAIIDANMKVGYMNEAFLAFQRAHEKNIVSWTSMIAGYARNGQGEQAVSFFIDMVRNGIQPDDFAFGAVLHACSSLAILGPGKMVHGCAVRGGFNGYAYIGNGLVNMYAKCGDLKGSFRAFCEIPDKDLVSWNAMLFAFGLHGQPNEALQFYEQMVATGLKPDKVTFIGLLMTCSHSGLIEESRQLYETMTSIHGLSPEMDHVACMVDMLGRGGYLAEAKDLAKKNLGTGTIDVILYEALLGACSTHQDVGFGKLLGKALEELEPHKERSYVMLSNFYCASGKWKEAEMVRQAMVDEGVKKMPGCSWIEVRNKVTTFVSGDHSCQCTLELYKVLNFLQFEMRNPYFVGF